MLDLKGVQKNGETHLASLKAAKDVLRGHIDECFKLKISLNEAKEVQETFKNDSDVELQKLREDNEVQQERTQN